MDPRPAWQDMISRPHPGFGDRRAHDYGTPGIIWAVSSPSGRDLWATIRPGPYAGGAGGTGTTYLEWAE